MNRHGVMDGMSGRFLAALGAGVLAVTLGACAHHCAEHQEVEIHKDSKGQVKAAKVTTITRVEPVGERVIEGRRLEPVAITSPGDRSYDAMTATWERPYPWGPRRTSALY
jgi:hypothetical protein